MKKYFVIIAALVAVAAVSCKKSELSDSEQLPGKYNYFTATIDDAVKTTLNTTSGAISWAEGDAIKIIWKEESVQQTAESLPLSADEAAASPVSFKADCTPVDNTYAVYPANTDAVWVGYMEVQIPIQQTGLFKDANIMAAKYLDNAFAFQNACGMLQFSVPAGVDKVVWTGDGINPIAGKVNVGFPEGIIYIDGVVKGSEENNITVNVDGAGTYYVAVAPGTYKNLYVSMYSGTTLVGEKQTFNDVVVARAQVKKMGTIEESLLSGRYFVKVEGSGAKDGSSWDNAADAETFVANVPTLESGTNIYLAAGNYVIPQISINTERTLSFYGGYPADATDRSLSGRNPKANVTSFDGNNSNRLFVLSNKVVSTWDGITFKNAYRTGTADAGSALILEGAGNTIVNNCVFKDNVNSSGRGGAMRVAPVSTSVTTITNCVFENNQATGKGTKKSTLGDGGAIVLTKGTFISKNNQYISNKSFFSDVEGGGGAIQIEPANNLTVNANFEGDFFDRNQAKTSTGSAIYACGSGKYVLKFNDCTFMHHRASSRGTIRAKNAADGNKVFFNACSFAADTVSKYGNCIHLQSPAVIHNCAFYANINLNEEGASNIYYDKNVLISNTTVRYSGSGTIGIREVGGINSVIVNTLIINTQTGSCLEVQAGMTLTSYGHNVIGTSGTTPITATGTYTVENPEAHPDYTYCYNAETAPWRILPDWIGSPNFVLKWTSWPEPGKPETLVLGTKERVEAAVDAFDATTNFGAKEWLNEIGALNADRRGTLRSETGEIWPGSYDNSASASL